MDHSITIDQAGYIYIYLSNEEETPIDVFFDDFKVTQTHSPVVQKDDYYPFGGVFASYSRPASTAQNFKYNNFEYQQDLGLNLYDYQARQYDPVLGRFTSVDPLSDLMRRYSPYNYAFDNPIRYTDPDGMMPEEGDQKKEEKRDPSAFEQLLGAVLSFMNEQGAVFNQALGNEESTFEENVSIYATHLELVAMPLAALEGSAGKSAKSNKVKKVADKADDIPTTLYRGDKRSPQTIFKEGFASQGDNLDLFDHANATYGTENSAYVSTSKSKSVAKKFAGKDGYVYEIDGKMVRGRDINRILGGSSPHPNEQEIAVPYLIKSDAVRSAQKNLPLSLLGKKVKN